MIKKLSNIFKVRFNNNSQIPNSVRAISFVLSVVLTTGGIGYAVVFAANTVIGNNIVTSGNLTVGGTTTFNTIAYTWPSADGSSGQTLSTNGSGVLSWTAGGGGSSLFTDGGATSYLTSADNLGVGTTSTAFKLGVQGNALFSGDIISVANVTATGTLTIGHSATTSAKLFVSDGVATGTPGLPGATQNLAWFAGNAANPTIGLENTSNNVRMGMLANTGSDGAAGTFLTFSNHPIAFMTNGGGGGATRMWISTDGNVGIGTTTPTSKLEVNGSGLFSANDSTLVVAHAATTSARLFVADGVATGTPGIPGTTQNLGWFVGNGAYPMMGLENTSAGVRMGMVAFNDEDGPHGILSTFTNHPLAFEVNSAGGGGARMWIATSGNIGIGTTTPTEKLSVIGNIAMSGNLLPTLAPAVTSTSSVSAASLNITEPGSSNAIPKGHSIALGADGFPVIAYRNVNDNSLGVTKCGDASCNYATTTSKVIGAGLVGEGDQSISIAIGTDGLPWITYGRATSLNLHVVRCANASCSATTSDIFVDGVAAGGGPNVGTSTSIVITNDQTPKIAYYDETNGELRHARCSTLACTGFATSTLDGAGALDVGAFNSMAVLPDDSLIISYYNITNGDLMAAKCKNASCGGGVSTTTVGLTADNVGKYTSVAIATDGMPIISYYDVANGNLNVVKCVDFGCQTTVTAVILDGAGAPDVGQYSSIAIGSDGFPIISYWDINNSDLKTAKCSNSTCSTTTATYLSSLDTSNPNSGTHSSIIIGTDGTPVIAYYSASAEHVKLFKCNDQSCQGLGTGFLAGGSDLGSLGKFFNNAYVESLWAKQISIKRFDLAEDYYSREDLNPGEIVSLDPSEALHIKKASNDGARVIGIVSTEPALVLSDFTAPASNDKNYPIALAGRVPLKVNSEGGAIAIGDAISLSSTSGVGKRASEGEKTLGYALDSFAGVNGTIRVFVSLNGEGFSADSESSNSLLGQVIGVVKNWLEGMKVFVEDGLVRMKDLVAEKITALGVTTVDLKVGSAETPSGITLFDKSTQQPFCVTVNNGQLQTAPGECASQVSAPADTAPEVVAPAEEAPVEPVSVTP